MANDTTRGNPFQRLAVFCGATTISHYVGADDAPLVIGKLRLSYVEIAQRTGLPAGRTARLISAVATACKANSIRDLYDNTEPHSVAVHGFGSGSLLMLFRLFESENLDVEKWANRGKYWSKDNYTTWTTYKKHDAEIERRTERTPPGGPRERDYRKKAVREQRKADRRAGI